MADWNAAVTDWLKPVVCVKFCKSVVMIRRSHPPGAAVARSPNLAGAGGGEGLAAIPRVEPERASGCRLRHNHGELEFISPSRFPVRHCSFAPRVACHVASHAMPPRALSGLIQA